MTSKYFIPLFSDVDGKNFSNHFCSCWPSSISKTRQNAALTGITSTDYTIYVHYMYIYVYRYNIRIYVSKHITPYISPIRTITNWNLKYKAVTHVFLLRGFVLQLLNHLQACKHGPPLPRCYGGEWLGGQCLQLHLLKPGIDWHINSTF